MTVQERLKQLTLTKEEQNLLAGGFCPKCQVSIRGPFRPVREGMHFFRPEIYATLREKGIDTRNGHYNNCPLGDIRLP